MRFLLFTFLLFLHVSYAKVPEKFSNSKYCIGCHVQKGVDWKTTWHSKSNSKKNPMYKSILKYIGGVTYKSIGNVEVNCGQCHSPKMGVKQVDFDYDMSKAFGIETDETKEVEDAMHNSTSDDGISCIICHNIDKIKHAQEINKRGFEAVEFGSPEIMRGPYKESHRTSYHKMQSRDYFTKDVNKLCLVCHYGYKDGNIYEYATGIEYESSNSGTKCVECHMGDIKKSIIAPNIVGNIKAVERDTRRHLFKGVRNSNIVKNFIKVSVIKNGSKIIVSLKNTTPHKFPTGFTGREVDISVTYKNGSKIISKQTKKINTLYVDKNNQETISYVADKMVFDKRLKPYEEKKYIFNIDNKANNAKIEIKYRLIKSSLVPILEIKDKIFTKQYDIFSSSLKI